MADFAWVAGIIFQTKGLGEAKTFHAEYAMYTAEYAMRVVAAFRVGA